MNRRWKNWRRRTPRTTRHPSSTLSRSSAPRRRVTRPTPNRKRQRRSSTAFCRMSPSIRAWRTTSFTASTIRSLPRSLSPPPAATRRLLRDRHMRCICRRTSSPTSACGMSRSPRISPPGTKRGRMSGPAILRCRHSTSCTPSTISSTPICRKGVTRTRRRSSTRSQQ